MSIHREYPFVLPWKDYYYKPLALKEDRHCSITVHNAGVSNNITNLLTIFVNDDYICNLSNSTYRFTFAASNKLAEITQPNKFCKDEGEDDGSTATVVSATMTEGNNTTIAWQVPGAADKGAFINNHGHQVSVKNIGPGVHFAMNSVSKVYNNGDWIEVKFNDEQREAIYQDLQKNKVLGAKSCWLKYPYPGDEIYSEDIQMTHGNTYNATILVNASQSIFHLGSYVNPNTNSGLYADLMIGEVEGAEHSTQANASHDVDYSNTSGAHDNHMVVFKVNKSNQEMPTVGKYHKWKLKVISGGQAGTTHKGQYVQLVSVETLN